MIKLKRTKAAGLYVVVGHEHIKVMHQSGRTWNAREGAVAYSKWYAYDSTKRREDAPEHDCCRMEGFRVISVTSFQLVAAFLPA